MADGVVPTSGPIRFSEINKTRRCNFTQTASFNADGTPTSGPSKISTTKDYFAEPNQVFFNCQETSSAGPTKFSEFRMANVFTIDCLKVFSETCSTYCDNDDAFITILVNRCTVVPAADKSVADGYPENISNQDGNTGSQFVDVLINTGSGNSNAGTKDLKVAGGETPSPTSGCISSTQARICVGGTLDNSNGCISKVLQHDTSFNLILRQTPFDDPTAADTRNCIMINNVPVGYNTSPRLQFQAACIQQQVVG